MRSPSCLCILPIIFGMPESIFMKLGMYIMAPESISTAYFVNPFHQSVCTYVSLLSLLGNARQIVSLFSLLGNGSVNTFSPPANTRNNRRIVGRVNLYAVRVLAKESVGCVSLYRC
jgi:hypothetical protein